jgi:hypothetical protein
MAKKLSLLLIVWFLVSCSERIKDNPFESGGQAPVSLSVLSYADRVELSWGTPNLSGYSGFNVYKNDQINKEYRLIAALPASERHYIDYDIEHRTKYTYYIRIDGGDMESKPTDPVSITPGPGINWIVDTDGYQILKTTYDLEHLFMTYKTGYAPIDLAVSTEMGTGIILGLWSGVVEQITTEGGHQRYYNEMVFPYAVAYDKVDSLFWIADSSGGIYTLNPRTENISFVSGAVLQPVSIDIAPENDLISVIDGKRKEIVQFNRNGLVTNRISSINDRQLQKPICYEIDEINTRVWVIDAADEYDLIFTKKLQDDRYTFVDSVSYRIPYGYDIYRDLDPDPINEMAWYVSINLDTANVMQLSADGTRHLELKNFYYPYNIAVNPYDGTLLVVDSGNRRVIHYQQSDVIMGMATNLNFPVKVRIQ